MRFYDIFFFFFFQAEDGIRDGTVTGVQTCALPISELSVRKVAPLPVRTSTVVADELPPAAEDPEPAGELFEPPELQAVARTAAAANGRPNLSANGIFRDDSLVSICCDSPLSRNLIPHWNLDAVHC